MWLLLLKTSSSLCVGVFSSPPVFRCVLVNWIVPSHLPGPLCDIWSQKPKLFTAARSSTSEEEAVCSCSTERRLCVGVRTLLWSNRKSWSCRWTGFRPALKISLRRTEPSRMKWNPEGIRGHREQQGEEILATTWRLVCQINISLSFLFFCISLRPQSRQVFICSPGLSRAERVWEAQMGFFRCEFRGCKAQWQSRLWSNTSGQQAIYSTPNIY